MESLLRDLGYALRTLRKSPMFAAAAIATLALGIGANTAIFSVFYTVLLKPLPYAEPGRLRGIYVEIPQFRDKAPSMPARPRDYLEWRRGNQVFTDLALFRGTNLNLTGMGEPERLDAMRVSASLFPVLGVEPERGRSFVAEEDRPGSDAVVILSHDFWMRRFGGDPGMVGREVELEGRACRVVGILRADFVFPVGRQFHPLLPLPPRIDVWVPMALSDAEIRAGGNLDYGVIARLKPGMNPREAEARLDALSVAFTRRDSPVPMDFHTRLIPLREIFGGAARKGLILLLAAVGVLLLIACVNLANLLMARMSGRRREFATRVALGAGRLRLARQLLTESVLLGTLGGAAGALLASWGTRVVTTLGPRDVPMLAQVSVNGPVLWFNLTMALATGMAIGVIPAMAVFRRDLHENLQEGARGFTEGPRAGRMRQTLVGVELALSTALLAAAGLLLHSFVNVMNVDRGFGVERIVSADVPLPLKSYTKPQQRVSFFREVCRRLEGLPGVAAVGAVTDLPLTNEAANKLIQLESDTRLRLDRPVAAYRLATPGYFDAMGIALRAGRVFREQEPAPVAVISESFAKAVWPELRGADATGRRFHDQGPRGPLITVIGVVADVRTTALDRKPMPQEYRPYTQGPLPEMSVVVRSAQEPESVARAIAAAIRDVDASLPAPAVRTMREMFFASLAERRFQMVLIGAFAGLAMALAVVGIYGVVSYSVARRTREIGLRMALGAQPGEVLAGLMKEGLRPVVLGVACGMVGAAVAARALGGLLYGVGPLDPMVLAGVVCVLLPAAAAACYVPGRRAACVDPTEALRHE